MLSLNFVLQNDTAYCSFNASFTRWSSPEIMARAENGGTRVLVARALPIVWMASWWVNWSSCKRIPKFQELNIFHKLSVHNAESMFPTSNKLHHLMENVILRKRLLNKSRNLHMSEAYREPGLILPNKTTLIKVW